MELSAASVMSTAKRGFQMTEVGLIPEDWSVAALDDICHFENGDRGHNYPSPGSFTYSGIPFVNAGHIAEGRIETSSLDYISRKTYDRLGAGKFRHGDILFCLRGSLGKFGVVGKEFGEGAIASSLVIVRPKPGPVIPEFLSYYFSSRICALMIDKWSGGAAQPNLGAQDLARFAIAIPSSKQEQRAIATALSDVDALLRSLDALIAKKKAIKQGTMQQLLTGKQRLPGFKEEWGTRPLRDLISLLPSGIYGAETQAEGLIPCRVATTAHIDMDDRWNDKEMGVRFFTSDQLPKYRPVAGDLIVVKSSGSAEKIQSGKMGLIDASNEKQFVFSNFLMLLRPKAMWPMFLYFYLCSNNVKKQLPNLVEASTYPNIRINDYLELPIPVPPTEEQTAIATVLSDMDAEIGALEARRAKTALLKQGMMQELLTGRTRLQY